MKRLFLSLLTITTLLPFSLSGMEKNSMPILEVTDSAEDATDSAEDASEVINLLHINNLNLNSHLRYQSRIPKTIQLINAIHLKVLDDERKEKEFEKNTIDTFYKPTAPNNAMATIIKNAEDKKKMKERTAQQLATDLKKVAEDKKHTNRSIVISGRTFNLNKEILSTRCPKLLEFSL